MQIWERFEGKKSGMSDALLQTYIDVIAEEKNDKKEEIHGFNYEWMKTKTKKKKKKKKKK